MFRLFDWECDECGDVTEHIIEFATGEGPPPAGEFPCYACEDMTQHTRCAVNLTAQYMGDKPIVAAVHGGRNDTMGHGPVTPLPTPPRELESKSDYMDWVHTPERREQLQQRQADRAKNRVKRERAQKLKRAGEPLDLRKHRVAGDPKI